MNMHVCYKLLSLVLLCFLYTKLRSFIASQYKKKLVLGSTHSWCSLITLINNFLEYEIIARTVESLFWTFFRRRMIIELINGDEVTYDMFIKEPRDFLTFLSYSYLI